MTDKQLQAKLQQAHRLAFHLQLILDNLSEEFEIRGEDALAEKYTYVSVQLNELPETSITDFYKL